MSEVKNTFVAAWPTTTRYHITLLNEIFRQVQNIRKNIRTT